MRIDELRDVLHEHAADPTDIGGSARSRAVHERIRGRRRRRAAAAAGGTVAAVAAVAALVVPSTGSPGDVAPAAPASPQRSERADGGLTSDDVTFRQEVEGRQFLGGVIGDPGVSKVYVDVLVGEAGIAVSELCYGPAADDYAVSVSVDGRSAGGVTCTQEAPADPAGDHMELLVGPGELQEWGLEPGDMVRLRAWLRPRTMDADDRASHPEMVIGAALYAQQPRVAALPERIDDAGQKWRLVSSVESTPGDAYLDLRTARRDEPTLVVLSTAGLEDPGRGTVLLDGETIEGLHDLRGSGGQSWQAVWGVEAGRQQELLVQVDEGLTAGTRLSLGEYVPAQ